MKRRLRCCRPLQTFGLILLAVGIFILALMFLPPIAWVFLAAIALIAAGVSVIKR